MNKITLPSEWAEQEFVQLTFPHAETDWAEMLEEVNDCFAKIAAEIAKREKLLVVCQNEQKIRKLLKDIDLKNLQFAEMPINDTWARDHAGITVIENGRKVIYDFCFNGWGMKFPANHDNKITRHLFENKAFTNDYTYKKCLNFVLEGGSIESDGAGTLLTTAQCLTADNRNYLSESELDEKLKNFFGLKQILWLHHGYLAGDDTDSHIDTLARLIPNNAIAYIKCENPEDEHYKALKLMENELKNFRTTDGKPYKLVALPMADAVLDKAGNKLPATYANFLIINSAVLVPTYNSPKDEIACDILQNVFKERKIVPVNCLPLITQHGSLHCVTMQFPK